VDYLRQAAGACDTAHGVLTVRVSFESARWPTAMFIVSPQSMRAGSSQAETVCLAIAHSKVS
jgi:hypothetical protein